MRENIDENTAIEEKVMAIRANAAIKAIEDRVMAIRDNALCEKNIGNNQKTKEKEFKAPNKKKETIPVIKKTAKKIEEVLFEEKGKKEPEEKKGFDDFSCLSSEKCARGYCHLFEQEIIIMCSNKRY